MAKPTALCLTDEDAESTLGVADLPQDTVNGNDKALLPTTTMQEKSCSPCRSGACSRALHCSAAVRALRGGCASAGTGQQLLHVEDRQPGPGHAVRTQPAMLSRGTHS